MWGVLAMIAGGGEPHRRARRIPACSDGSARIQFGAFPERELNMPAEKFHHDVKLRPESELRTGNFKGGVAVSVVLC